MEEIELNINNPYAGGYVVEFLDGTMELQTDLPTYPPNERDEFSFFREGDSLSSLSGKYYSDSKLWHILYHANLNVIEDPLNLPIGKEFRIPYVDL